MTLPRDEDGKSWPHQINRGDRKDRGWQPIKLLGHPRQGFHNEQARDECHHQAKGNERDRTALFVVYPFRRQRIDADVMTTVPGRWRLWTAEYLAALTSLLYHGFG